MGQPAEPSGETEREVGPFHVVVGAVAQEFQVLSGEYAVAHVFLGQSQHVVHRVELDAGGAECLHRGGGLFGR